jgi:hypothetical protein
MHVAALKGGFGKDLADGGARAGVIVGDDELDAVETAPAQADEEAASARTMRFISWPNTIEKMAYAVTEGARRR